VEEFFVCGLCLTVSTLFEDHVGVLSQFQLHSMSQIEPTAPHIPQALPPPPPLRTLLCMQTSIPGLLIDDDTHVLQKQKPDTTSLDMCFFQLNILI
jgi:hypothetical protein